VFYNESVIRYVLDIFLVYALHIIHVYYIIVYNLTTFCMYVYDFRLPTEVCFLSLGFMSIKLSVVVFIIFYQFKMLKSANCLEIIHGKHFENTSKLPSKP